MASKPKSKAKAAKKSASPVKSTRLKAKPAKLAAKRTAPASRSTSQSTSRPGTKAAKPAKGLKTNNQSKALSPRSKGSSKPAPTSSKVESRRTPVAARFTAAPPAKVRSRHYASALQAYEAGIKLMHAEEYQKAIKCFEELVNEYSEEPEIQERAKVLIHASEKRLHEKARTVVRSAEEHYNIAIAELNRRSLESAIQHLQQGLKLAPKADHILYALAAANALQGNRDQALTFLKESIHHRPENRFFAARDDDFNNLNEDSDFKQLVTPSEK
jgi:tetratricopeptide (TPR) repeat protein